MVIINIDLRYRHMGLLGTGGLLGTLVGILTIIIIYPNTQIS